MKPCIDADMPPTWLDFPPNNYFSGLPPPPPPPSAGPSGQNTKVHRQLNSLHQKKTQTKFEEENIV